MKKSFKYMDDGDKRLFVFRLRRIFQEGFTPEMMQMLQMINFMCIALPCTPQEMKPDECQKLALHSMMLSAMMSTMLVALRVEKGIDLVGKIKDLFEEFGLDPEKDLYKTFHEALEFMVDEQHRK